MVEKTTITKLDHITAAQAEALNERFGGGFKTGDTLEVVKDPSLIKGLVANPKMEGAVAHLEGQETYMIVSDDKHRYRLNMYAFMDRDMFACVDKYGTKIPGWEIPAQLGEQCLAGHYMAAVEYISKLEKKPALCSGESISFTKDAAERDEVGQSIVLRSGVYVSSEEAIGWCGDPEKVAVVMDDGKRFCISADKTTVTSKEEHFDNFAENLTCDPTKEIK